MAVFDLASIDVQREYMEQIGLLCSLSNLFSTSNKPYLDYRLAENVFCNCFNAENLSRSCAAIDAKIGLLGIGIKTFVDTPYQKIAEFDHKINEFNNEPEHDAKVVSVLRNRRLDFSKDSYGVCDFIYHYIVRSEGMIRIYESSMDYINVDEVKIIRSNNGNFDFTDGKNMFRFNRAKSTLFEYFDLNNYLSESSISIIENPMELIMTLRGTADLDCSIKQPIEEILLPLFSTRGGRHVPQFSGLNQWNARGRARDFDEVYIPVPKKIRNDYPNFFPPRYVPFLLILPDGEEINATICQQDGKALMSNPNKALGNWLLRRVLRLQKGELVTIELLDDIGVDSVIISKYSDYYKIDFTYVGDVY